MSNMSYCRFENTLRDLRDCNESLRNFEPLSVSEAKACKELLDLCGDMSEIYEPADINVGNDEDEEDE